ncbi:mannose-6-phosphate isomerase, class I [Sutcliffiella sp. NC1]|uniref:mannose-6-phosphate isomerase, class I n=1 Tax=Sutcliffiella sp. NC1 TaxID=3004096 RepID=UPI0022DE7312|nr:mannose-6-phosphate isomerase, class I [Sutcliffiella sp. NC1]WBL17694.1 mannose-6-phosphate isomerase, class I [Sutcliffiella sp. NC1]
MMNQPIFLSPTFQERIWGGTKLATEFNYKIPSDITGECWAVSGHPNGQSIVKDGPFKGMSLGDLYQQHKELFGNYKSDVFPLLTKILDANDDLSVQVHPDDVYANKYENGELGKTECWYVIDCEKDAEIIFGHTAKTKEQLSEMIENGEWESLLTRVKVKPGDFFYVPSGTIHALCAGVLILETQQSSDTTYRVYDYDRKDKEGNTRELHLEKSIDVTKVPHEGINVKPIVNELDGATITTFIKEKYFSVYKWDITKSYKAKQDKHFLIGSVIGGEGQLITESGSFSIGKGDHFILPNELESFIVEGNVSLIVSHP